MIAMYENYRNFMRVIKVLHILNYFIIFHIISASNDKQIKIKDIDMQSR